MTAEDGCLSMKYGVIALMAAVSNARTILKLNATISQLQNEIKTLKKQLNNEQ